tara:strand:+ start:2925 stop:4313 length:1389 start_codon:yes stop_codon:yes gene_type:complete
MLSLANAILSEDVEGIQNALRYGEDVNEIDVYGFTPLIEAAIADNAQISQLLLSLGANPNGQGVTGSTALHWAAENANAELCQLLLEHGADPNAYTLSGQPLLVMPVLRSQTSIRQILIQGGANLAFAQEYINTKLLGHMYELAGMASIVDTNNEYVEVDFEGFLLEVTIGIIGDSLYQFQNHFAARQLRRYAGVAQYIVGVLKRASQLIKYQQYRVDTKKSRAEIDALLTQEPVVIPVGYEGHAITFIRHGDMWVKCDRREDSRLYDNIVFYRIQNRQNLTPDLLRSLVFRKQTSDFINKDLDRILGLKPITEIKVDAQISGNCSWANVEATIPAIFFMVMMDLNKNDKALGHYKSLSLNFFHRWREWNKDRALHNCIKSFNEGDVIRKASKAEILVAILFQRCDPNRLEDKSRIDTILSVLIGSPYEYVLRNYLKIYLYQGMTDEGKRFNELLQEYGFNA